MRIATNTEINTDGLNREWGGNSFVKLWYVPVKDWKMQSGKRTLRSIIKN
jgi:hypothetical protein